MPLTQHQLIRISVLMTWLFRLNICFNEGSNSGLTGLLRERFLKQTGRHLRALPHERWPREGQFWLSSAIAVALQAKINSGGVWSDLHRRVQRELANVYVRLLTSISERTGGRQILNLSWKNANLGNCRLVRLGIIKQVLFEHFSVLEKKWNSHCDFFKDKPCQTNLMTF